MTDNEIIQFLVQNFLVLVFKKFLVHFKHNCIKKINERK